MPGNNTKKIIVSVAAVILIVVVGWRVYKKAAAPSSEYSGGATLSNSAPITREQAPEKVSVPGVNSSNVPANVAKPNIVGPAGPNRSASFRSFALSVSGNQFSPDTVIVNVGDTVRLNITAADKNYDFSQPDYGFSVPLQKGQTKQVEFGATAEGKFTFYCKLCGGPAKGPVGYIVVVAK